jgi:hypothetical protein
VQEATGKKNSFDWWGNRKMWPEPSKLYWVCNGWCNNSVWSRLKAVTPFCVQHKRICQSLALCIQYAVSKPPSNIGILLSEIHSWFCHSELKTL